MSTWVNFKELRQQLAFGDVLQHYGIELKVRGDQHHGFCPLPNHVGKRNSPSFSANLTRGIFQCFGCGAKGNTVEFAALMEKVDIENGSAFREIAIRLQDKFCSRPPDRKIANQAKGAGCQTSPCADVRIVNAPLDFELKQLDTRHPYLLKRAHSAKTISHFGLGFTSRGMLADRIAIPLHSQEGKLVGYAGRVVNDLSINADNPKYRFPGPRKHDGRTFEFRKTLLLYNGFRIRSPVDELFVLEGFASVWWFHENGLSNCIATMGADVSKTQLELILSLVKPFGRIWVISDGDEAGERFERTLLAGLSRERFIRCLRLGNEKQPTDLSSHDLKTLVGF